MTGDLHTMIRRAIADPGAITPRVTLHQGWAGPEYESVSNWSARAVQIVIDRYHAEQRPSWIDRAELGRLVRRVWVEWATGQPDAKPGWLLDYDDPHLDDGQREVDNRIGETLAAVASPEAMLREMHTRFGIHGGWLPDTPTADVPDEIRDVRWALIDEEVNLELRPALESGDLIGIADACADAVATIVGTAISYGLPFDALLREVHRSNMTKSNDPAAPKLVKGDGYERPDITGVLAAARKELIG